MKKIIFAVVSIALFQLFSNTSYAQKEKANENTREIIIIKNGDKERKLTIETKNGEVFINGKPSTEFKDSDISVIKNKFKNGLSFSYTPESGMFSADGEKKAFLGVTTEKTDDGAKVTNISRGSAAEKAGLKEGDIITKIGSKAIANPDDLMNTVTTYKPKQDVNIFYKRDGKTEQAKATLGERTMMSAFNLNMNGFKNNMQNLNLQMEKLRSLPRHPFTMQFGLGQGKLGLSIEDTDNDSGAKITDVDEESPAAKSGLKENDIITEVNGKKVKDVNELKREISDVKDKNNYNIKAKRNNSDMNFEVKIPKKINKATL